MSRTTDKYIKIKKTAEPAPENEIRIKAIPQIGRYITYAASLLLEKKLDTVVIKASGNAIKNACQIAELLRHKILGLHQLNVIKTITVTDEYEPREDGLEKVVMQRQLAVLEISLSLKDDVFDKTAVGYQAPLPAEEVQQEELKNILEGRRRGGPGGERGGERRGGPGDDRREDRGEGYERRGGRGRGRGGRGRGRGRGGYGGGYENRGDRGGYENRGDRGGYENRGDRGYENRGDRGYENRGDRGGYESRGGYEDRPRGRGQTGGRGEFRSRGRGGDRRDRREEK